MTILDIFWRFYWREEFISNINLLWKLCVCVKIQTRKCTFFYPRRPPLSIDISELAETISVSPPWEKTEKTELEMSFQKYVFHLYHTYDTKWSIFLAFRLIVNLIIDDEVYLTLYILLSIILLYTLLLCV